MDRTLVVIGAVAGVAVAAVGGAAWFMPVPPPPPAAAPPVATAPPAPKPAAPSWIPAGFTKWPGQDVAFRWSSSTFKPGCDEDRFCMVVEVVPRTGCDNLYVSASLLDGRDQNIGYTNDTTSGVGAGETALMALNSYEGAAQSMRISEINCL